MKHVLLDIIRFLHKVVFVEQANVSGSEIQDEVLEGDCSE